MASLCALQQPADLCAQADRRGTAIRLVPGVAYADAALDDDQPGFDGTVAFTIGAQLWGGVSRTTGLQAELTYQQTRVWNPGLQEGFTALYLLGGPEFALGSGYVRPNVGVAWIYPSGADAKGDADNAFAFGLAVGTERRVDKSFHLAPELVARASTESGLTTWMVALQVGIGWRSNPY
jgi:hypothetical protein